ncbi:MAG: ABC transporter permease [Anaerolineae bacterium]|nr:ABC transporter permease [Anaerolineae bacterium]
MSVMSSARSTSTLVTASTPEGSMPFLLQVSMMTWRTLVTNFRVPAAVIPSLIISVFFLLVYDSSLSGAATFFLNGQSYLGFMLPFSVVSSALSGASVAGQSIVRDIESGYFDKLMLTPINRGALLLGPMIAGAIILVLQTVLIVGVALLMGLQPATGAPGLLAIIGFALLLGTGFSGFTVAIALLTGNAAATGGASFLFFPLSFLTASFVPYELLTGWIKTAAFYNPITYILDAMRTIMNVGWETDIILRGLGSCLVLGAILFTWSLVSLRSRTQRK